MKKTPRTRKRTTAPATAAKKKATATAVPALYEVRVYARFSQRAFLRSRVVLNS